MIGRWVQELMMRRHRRNGWKFLGEMLPCPGLTTVPLRGLPPVHTVLARRGGPAPLVAALLAPARRRSRAGPRAPPARPLAEGVPTAASCKEGFGRADDGELGPGGWPGEP